MPTHQSTASDDTATDRPIETQEHDLRQRVLQNPGVRALIGARLLASLGLATLSYGAMVYLATVGASQVSISLIGATRYFAALLFGIGFVLGTALGPWLMDRRGERALGVMALAILSLGFVLFGLVDLVAPILAPFSPLRVLNLFGIATSQQMEAAGLISIFTALGSTGAAAAVQTYVNRYVLLARQPATFGMQEVIDNALTLFAVLTFVVVWLIRVCFRVSEQDPPQARAILDALLDTSQSEPTSLRERA